MFAILFVLDDPEKLNEILSAWQSVGVRGVTVFETTGLHRIKRPHIPMRYTFGNLSEPGNLSLFAVVEQQQTIEACLSATEAVIGSLDQPHTGIFTAWPLAFTKGIANKQPHTNQTEGDQHGMD